MIAQIENLKDTYKLLKEAEELNKVEGQVSCISTHDQRILKHNFYDTIYNSKNKTKQNDIQKNYKVVHLAGSVSGICDS